MKMKYIFLTISLVAFVVGFSDAGESAFWYMGRPVGAIFFMLYMIFNLLEKESALLDEQRKRTAEENEKHLHNGGSARSKPSAHCAPVLTTASLH